jgi:hypothetical protein
VSKKRNPREYVEKGGRLDMVKLLGVNVSYVIGIKMIVVVVAILQNKNCYFLGSLHMAIKKPVRF